MSKRYLQWIYRQRWLVLAISLLLVVIAAAGIPKLTISNDFRVYFSKDNPQLQRFEQFEANFGQSNSATIVVSNPQADLFTPQGLQLIRELTDAMWQLDYVIRVDSLANYQYTYAEQDDVFTEDLIPKDTKLTPPLATQIGKTALQEKRIIHRLLTADGKLSLIFAQVRLPDNQANPSLIVTAQLEQLRDRFAKKYPQFLIEYGGSTTFNTTLSRAVARDLETLLPLSYLVIFAGLWFLLRRAAGTFQIFVLVTGSMLATFGVFGWFSPLLTPIAGFAPSILLSIMVADAVHLLATYYQQIDKGESRLEATQTSFQLNFMPVVLTSVTTAIGFLSLNFSSSPPYQDLGNMVAIGVAFALTFSVFTLPAMMLVMPLKAAHLTKSQINFSIFSRFVIRNAKQLAVGVVAVTFFLTAFVPNNRLSDNWAHYFSDQFSIVRLVNKIDGYLTGINALEYVVKPGTGLSVTSPAYLNDLEKLDQWVRQQELVFNSNSLLPLLKDLNQTMHGDDPQMYRLPESQPLAAQYLLLYELSLPQGLGIDNILLMDHSASRYSVSINNAGSDQLLALDKKIQQYAKQHCPAISFDEATGLGMVFAHIADRNISSLLKGTGIALLLISLLLIILFRSIKLGILSLIPNIIPAVMAYGLWGLFFGYIDISLSIVACATLGIVVDDTIHFLHKYQHGIKNGLTTKDAIEKSFQRTGVPLLTTSAVLASGFLILTLSPMTTSATIGLLMAITLLFALLVDFLLLPPLLLFFDRQQNSRQG